MAVTPRERREGRYVKNAAGLYVPEEPVSTTLMASATTGDVLTVKADDTVHPRTITGAGGIVITVGADEIEVDGSGISGSGGIPYPNTPPGSPQTEDDEFDSSSLDAKWTQTLTGAPSVDIDTVWPSAYRVQLQAGGAARESELEQAFAPAGDFRLTARAFGAFSQQDQACDLWALNTAETEGFLVQHRFGTTVPESAFTTFTGGAFTQRAVATTGVTGGDVHGLYLHLTRTGTTLAAWFSTNGFSWRRLGTHSLSFTCNKIRLRATAPSGASTPVWAGWDWVRRDWAGAPTS